MAGRRVEWGLVWNAGVDGGLHGVVALEDEALGAKLAVVALLVLAHHEERVEHVLDFRTVRP